MRRSDDHIDDPGDDSGRDHERDRVGAGRRANGKLVALLVVVVLILVFVLQNRDRASIDFLFWDVDVRIWFGLAIAVVLGFAAGFIVARTWRRPRSGPDA